MGVHIQVQHAKSKGKPNAGDNECFECGREGHWARDCPRRRRYDSYRRPPPPRSSYREPYRGIDSYRPDSYRGPDRGYRDSYYSDSYYGSRYSAPPRYSPYSPYGGYGGRSMRSRSPPPRSYHSSYAYAPRR
ncbi:RNA-binding lark-like isoform X1 [Paramuricea clavata]|uniref:RNA-binding lark-like isoform X1 n=1 Tax=Paramuricea clavata TaxID=317549 RepID=A0A6S7KB91_PARCT|nr:RNA-binding lark-like isoform X1 [Paramuricea clavata]CAB4041998.1 RNA-binding lark-like isoform X1 [Paramuricea clavata]